LETYNPKRSIKMLCNLYSELEILKRVKTFGNGSLGSGID